ncbi:MAG TPA: transaldolase [Chloroflexi bacterium]|nr:transaldolase [Chloroflexota bacterium]
MEEKLRELKEHGQSLWYDNISRDLMDAGVIQKLVEDGILGMTSNPTIFMKAITGGNSYDAHLRELARSDKSPQEIYEELAIVDIRRAADILRPVYDETKGEDGYVSLEVSPFLAHRTDETVAEAVRLFEWLDRPNVMIKIPATPEGLPAIEEAIARGLNVNVTLIFSLDVYTRVMEAYLRGLERRIEAGQEVSGIASVASFFVSRVDTLVDKLLDERIAASNDPAEQERLRNLKGRAAVANAKLAYQLFKQTFVEGERFQKLAEKGARLQRPLWASTSTKNPAYSDVKYVEELIGPHTVNTAPPHTIEAFLDHGRVADTLEQGVEEARAVMEELAGVGIDMKAVTDELLEKGVEAFADSFRQLLDAIEAKCEQLAGAAAP